MRMPSRERFFLARKWYKDGVKHRTHGPAMEYDDGAKVWTLDGQTKYVETGSEEDDAQRLRFFAMRDFPGYEEQT